MAVSPCSSRSGGSNLIDLVDGPPQPLNTVAKSAGSFAPRCFQQYTRSWVDYRS